MQIRQSKTLENLVTKTIFETAKDGADNHPFDRLFLALLDEANCHASHILKKMLKDWELYQVRVRIEREIEKLQLKQTQPFVQAEFLNTLYAGLENACRSLTPQATVLNTGHLLIYMLKERRYVSSRVLELYHMDLRTVIEYLVQLPAEEDYYKDMRALENIRMRRSESQLPPASSSEENTENEEEEGDYSASAVRGEVSGKSATQLEKFGLDLTKAAAQGKIDPVVGREKEIERLIQILGRRKKNNPILIGEAGVGKSAIVEGLALRIASRDVPYALRGKTLFSLDVTSLVAGTKYRGQFEERMKGLLHELCGNKNIILFIDEIHTIVGAGSTQGSLDTANILKPVLARGELQCIGATTLDEYRENIESDSALERRFQKIIVEPTTREQTLEILSNIRPHYEKHHLVRYTDEALRACVELSERYITERHFPDKAIDVLDEAGSKAHVFQVREPEFLQELERSMEEAGAEKRKAVAELVYNRAAEARLREMALHTRLEEERAKWQRELSLHPVVVDEEHVAEVISTMTGIPAQRVSQGEKTRLQGMFSHLDRAVVGQKEAIGKITKSLQRSRAGLKDPNKPIGVFMFVGPSGVGKTLLAKELSRWMFDRDDALVRVDMSEYSEKHNVSRLIGSPPGYVGYNEGGQLTETIRRQPYSVVLFDEIEKAHPDIFNIMLQIFDEGHLTDGLGRKVDFRNTVIIMTSNVGSRAVARRPNAVGYNTSNSALIEQVNLEHQYRGALESTFAPEFINRIDDIVIFNTLSLENVKQIVELELSGLNHRAEALGYTIRITDDARERLAELGYEPKYGVRSLKRIILDRVEEPLAEMIVSGEVSLGDEIDVDYVDDDIKLLSKAV